MRKEPRAWKRARFGLTNRVIKRSNAMVTDMFGFRSDEVAGRSLSLFYPAMTSSSGSAQSDWNGCEEAGAIGTERIMKRRSGELFWCRVRGQSMMRGM